MTSPFGRYGAKMPGKEKAARPRTLGEWLSNKSTGATDETHLMLGAQPMQGSQPVQGQMTNLTPRLLQMPMLPSRPAQATPARPLLVSPSFAGPAFGSALDGFAMPRTTEMAPMPSMPSAPRMLPRMTRNIEPTPNNLDPAGAPLDRYRAGSMPPPPDSAPAAALPAGQPPTTGTADLLAALNDRIEADMRRLKPPAPSAMDVTNAQIAANNAAAGVGEPYTGFDKDFGPNNPWRKAIMRGFGPRVGGDQPNAFADSTWVPEDPSKQGPRGVIAQSRFGGDMIYTDPVSGRAKFIEPSGKPLDERRAAEALAIATGRSMHQPARPEPIIGQDGRELALAMPKPRTQQDALRDYFAKREAANLKVPEQYATLKPPAPPTPAAAPNAAPPMPGMPSPRDLITQRAMAKADARLGRLANRNAPPDPMMRMMMDNPELAVQMAGLNQRGMLAQQEAMLRMQLAQQQAKLERERMVAAGKEAGLDRSSRETIAGMEREGRNDVRDLELRQAAANIQAQALAGALDAKIITPQEFQKQVNAIAQSLLPPPPSGSPVSIMQPQDTTENNVLPPQIAQEMLDGTYGAGTYKNLQSLGENYGWDIDQQGIGGSLGALADDLFGRPFAAPGSALDRRAEYMAGRLLQDFERGAIDDRHIGEIARALRSKMDPGFIAALDDPNASNDKFGWNKGQMTPARKLLSHILKGNKYKDFKLSDKDRQMIRSTGYSTYLKQP